MSKAGAKPDTAGEEDESIGDLFGRLIDDGQAYAQAEIDLLKTRAQAEINRYRGAAILAGAAIAVGTAALIVFSVTLIIAFSLFMPPLLAGLCSLAILGIAFYLLVAAARRRIEDPVVVKRSVSGPDDD